ncbi:hypothetical protein [Actinomycetospora aeridis]|uniref:Uncharacterized protein n=1 Tax=Actinomycetospora aeridis TaxID=3129231 RepID=A0ABU8N3Y6_9PSEU
MPTPRREGRSPSVPPRPVPRPPALGRALVVALLQVPVSLLGLVLLMNDSSALSGIADVLYGRGGITTDGSTAQGIAETLPVAFFLVGNGVWLWLTARMWAGRDWARVTMTGLSVLTVLALFPVLPSGDATTTVPAVLAAGLAVALVAFLYRPECGPWFGRR